MNITLERPHEPSNLTCTRLNVYIQFKIISLYNFPIFSNYATILSGYPQNPGFILGITCIFYFIFNFCLQFTLSYFYILSSCPLNMLLCISPFIPVRSPKKKKQWKTY